MEREKDVTRLVFRDGPAADEEDRLAEVMLQLQLVILRHPVAAQALFRALVVEGRRFAQTPDGRRWAAALVDSPLLRRARMVWDVVTLRTLDDDPATLVPSAIVDAFVKVSAVDALEPFLSRLFEGVLDGDG